MFGDAEARGAEHRFEGSGYVNVPNVSLPNVSGGPNQVLQGAGPLNPMNQMNPMMNIPHMARNQPANVIYQGSK